MPLGQPVAQARDNNSSARDAAKEVLRHARIVLHPRGRPAMSDSLMEGGDR
jgi:hypothetical protein